jgi:hypothetical protein
MPRLHVIALGIHRCGLVSRCAFGYNAKIIVMTPIAWSTGAKAVMPAMSTSSSNAVFLEKA